MVFFRANLFIEFPLCLIGIFNIFKFKTRGLKFLIIVGSVMTFYKSLLYLLYTIDLQVGGHVVENWALEIFGVYGSGLVWVSMTAIVAQTLIADFLKSELHKQ